MIYWKHLLLTPVLGNEGAFSPQKGVENGWKKKKIKKSWKKLQNNALSLLPGSYNCFKQDISNNHLAESSHRLDSLAGQAEKNHK